MKIIVYTGRIQDGHPDLLDITMKMWEEPANRTQIGAILAPKKWMVYGHKSWRYHNHGATENARFQKWKQVSTEEYHAAYRELLLERFRQYPERFKEVLVGRIPTEHRTITLGCYCAANAEYCHRLYVAKHILPGCAEWFNSHNNLGIIYEYAGEW